jgi:hypothetical protein
MFFVHLIEIDATVVGIVAQEGKAYRFYAVKSFFRQLEDRVFDNTESARIAALALSPLRHKTRPMLLKAGSFKEAIPSANLVFDNVRR